MQKMHAKKKNKAACTFDGLEDNRLSYKYWECGEKWHDSIKRSSNKFPSIYQFCNRDLNKFLFLLRKGAYPYQDMDNREKFDEATIPPKEAFCSKINLEGTSNADYAHAQKV